MPFSSLEHPQFDAIAAAESTISHASTMESAPKIIFPRALFSRCMELILRACSIGFQLSRKWSKLNIMGIPVTDSGRKQLKTVPQ